MYLCWIVAGLFQSAASHATSEAEGELAGTQESENTDGYRRISELKVWSNIVAVYVDQSHSCGGTDCYRYHLPTTQSQMYSLLESALHEKLPVSLNFTFQSDGYPQITGVRAKDVKTMAGSVRYTPTLTIFKFRIKADGIVQFGVDAPPSDSCAYFGYQFALDGSTDEGKSVLSFLMSAKLAKQQINVWSYASAAPGTNETSGCTEAALSSIYSPGTS